MPVKLEDYIENTDPTYKENRKDRTLQVPELAIEAIKRACRKEGRTWSDIYYVVWSCKTLQNWKALVSSPEPGAPYYEVTHNGDKNETYVDRYFKEVNIRLTQEDK